MSNKEEIAFGTDSSNPDTDGDGLSDGDEVNKYGTDSLKADSDEDTLTDGDEIALGLNPSNPETFGVPDAEYKFEQTISADSEALSEINTEEAPYELSLKISASGNAVKKLNAESSMFSAATDSSARVGEAVNLSYVGGEVDKVKLVYKINDEYISNDGSEYAENCLDLKGIKRYNIFRYFEDINMLLPVATQFDGENNILYAETDELGTYCLLDMEILLQQLNIAPDGETFEAARPMLLAVSAEDSEEYVSDDYCITFIFDIRKGKITEEQLDKMKNEVLSFADEAFAFNPNTEIRLLTQDVSDFDDSSFKVVCDSAVTLDEINTALDKIKVSRNSGIFGNYCIISEALAYTAEHSDTSVNNYIFDFYNQKEAIFEENISDELLEKIKSQNINISIISPESDTITGYQKMLSEITGGITIDKSGDSGYKRLYKHVYDKKVVEQSFSAILITGYQTIELKGKLSEYNGIDTDEDTLTDWEEVGVEHWIEKGLITYDVSGNIMLPTIEQCMRFTECSYVEEGLERFQSDYGRDFGTAILGVRVLPILSDPTRIDSDNDGINDIDDAEKLRPDPMAVKDINLTPLIGNNQESTICVIKLYNGDFIWQQWNNSNPREIAEYYINNEVKLQLSEYNKTANFAPEKYYPWDYWFDSEILEKIALRDLKRQVATQKQLLDNEFLRDYPIITQYSDEYYGMWVKYVELKQRYDEAGLLVRDMGYLIADVFSLGIAAHELLGTIRQYAAIRHTVKLVGGKENFAFIKDLLLNYGDEAIDAWTKYGEISDKVLSGELDSKLIDELIQSGEKYTLKDVLAIEKTSKGRLVWLEKGNTKSGYEHILKHRNDFIKYGISEDEIIDVIMKAVYEENIIGYQGKGNGRPIYSVCYKGQTYQISISVGSNGYIVGANPYTGK